MALHLTETLLEEYMIPQNKNGKSKIVTLELTDENVTQEIFSIKTQQH